MERVRGDDEEADTQFDGGVLDVKIFEQILERQRAVAVERHLVLSAAAVKLLHDRPVLRLVELYVLRGERRR